MMTIEEKLEFLLKDLPDADSARRFFQELEKGSSYEAKRLLKKEGLLADVLALASWSSFLGTTVLQNLEYISWLERKRKNTQLCDKEQLFDSLARYSATHSSLDAHVLLSRFRRRELLRIYLRDLRGLATIAEITEELSNLADAILEHALRIARQELDNKFGVPLETDDKGRTKVAEFCVVSLGKLGSHELNYASDIDLLFIYSNDGITSATGSRHAVTNREFFVKLAEQVAKIVGETKGEGAAYRVDLRLRPHGRVGALAVSLKEAINYYQKTALSWERQVLIRSRNSAGEAKVFKQFWSKIVSKVYSPNETVAQALENVRLSKQKINQEHASEKGFNVKLGKGGIREIEFIAQALQLAYGGKDAWLRAPHTLISLSRLADRDLLNENELTALSEAYKFLRKLEHRLQMEHGLQTHAVSDEPEKRLLMARKMNCRNLSDFNAEVKKHTEEVSAVFERVFSNAASTLSKFPKPLRKIGFQNSNPLLEVPESKTLHQSTHENHSLMWLEKADVDFLIDDEKISAIKSLSLASPHFAAMVEANPKLIQCLPTQNDEIGARNYLEILRQCVEKATNLHDELVFLRTAWSQCFLEIGVFDAFEKIEMSDSNRMQSELAEASLQVALEITKREISRKFAKTSADSELLESWNLGILGLGKLGSRGMDYGSDLDLVLIFDEEKPSPIEKLTPSEFYSRVVEILVNTLSSLMREGHLYRVDLRLRPDGKNGATATGKQSFLNYLENRSAIWEWLAYVKLRSILPVDFAQDSEIQAREIIHRRARAISPDELKSETKRVREMLHTEKTKGLRRGEIEIKHGAGGLLDVYFAVRFLQLRDDVKDTEETRSTFETLPKLYEAGSLDSESFRAFSEGYDFLRRFDHALRLVNGRSARVPDSENPLLEKIAHRLKVNSVTELLHLLNLHRVSIRQTYEDLLN